MKGRIVPGDIVGPSSVVTHTCVVSVSSRAS